MGELARQTGCPELAATPLELLTPRPDHGAVVLDDWVWPYLGGLIGLISARYRNYLLSRPSWAGIPYYILFTAGGAFTLNYYHNERGAIKAEINEMHKHYITLHPEDFPPYERKRYRDVYQRFSPRR